jgi:hypothetical protein
MSTNNNKNNFSPLQIPHQPIITQIAGYKIYTSESQFMVVEARMVAEAIRKSGVENPIRIERIGSKQPDVMLPAELVEKNDNEKEAAAQNEGQPSAPSGQ